MAASTDDIHNELVKISNDSYSILGVDREILDILRDFQSKGFGTGSGQGSSYTAQGPSTADTRNIDDATKKTQTLGETLSGVKSGFNDIFKGIGSMGATLSSFINTFIGDLNNVDEAASRLTRNIGGTSESIKRMRREMYDAMTDNLLGQRFNVATEDLIKLQESLANATGKAAIYSKKNLEELAASSNFMGENNTIEYINRFRNLGKDITQVNRYTGKMYADATKLGINYQNVSKNFLNNLKAAQTYTFAEGTRGLMKMAERAAELNINMESAFRAASKMDNIQGAIEASARLSVLGGTFASNGNPMELLYESLNDPAALQDRILRMASDKVYFDREKGELSMSGVDRKMLNEAAKALGVDANELISEAYNKSRYDIVNRQMGTNVPDELRGYLRNISELNSNGEAYVSYNGRDVTMSEINNMNSEELAKFTDYMKSASQTESEDIKEIVQHTKTLEEIFKGTGIQREATLGKIANSTGILDELKSKAPDYLNKFWENVYKFFDWCQKNLSMKNYIGGFGAMMVRAGKQTLSGIGKIISNIYNFITGGVKKGAQKVAGKAAGKASSGVLGTLGRWLGKGVRLGGKVLGKALPGIVDAGFEAYDQFFGDQVGNGSSTGQKIARVVTKGLLTAGGAALGGAATGGVGAFGGGVAGSYAADKLMDLEALSWLYGKNNKEADSGFHFAEGGPVVGPGTSTSDSIRARLSNGEYVVPADAASIPSNRQVLDSMRSGNEYSAPSKITLGDSTIRIEGGLTITVNGIPAGIRREDIISDDLLISQITNAVNKQNNILSYRGLNQNENINRYNGF